MQYSLVGASVGGYITYATLIPFLHSAFPFSPSPSSPKSSPLIHPS